MPVSGGCRGLHFGEIREVVHRLDGAVLRLEAMDGLAIAEEQKLRLQGGMVAEGLLQHGLGECDARGLALNNHQGTALVSEDHGIGTLVQAVHLDGILHRHQACRHVQMLNQEVQHLLPDLLFGRQRDKTTTQRVEDLSPPLLHFRFEPLQTIVGH